MPPVCLVCLFSDRGQQGLLPGGEGVQPGSSSAAGAAAGAGDAWAGAIPTRSQQQQQQQQQPGCVCS